MTRHLLVFVNVNAKSPQFTLDDNVLQKKRKKKGYRVNGYGVFCFIKKKKIFNYDKDSSAICILWLSIRDCLETKVPGAN